MWLYPPYLGAGISVQSVSQDSYAYVIQLKQRWWNRNVNGSHFGGSLFAMCDPWYVFIAAAYFGDRYVLWDKSASIEFLLPGKGKVTAQFAINEAELVAMKEEVDRLGKQTFHFTTYVVDSAGQKVALVQKEIYIRRKAKIIS